ncbi:hypothetical protein [Tahibacter amnicola]|uniref:Uncharacterized protein n=1 Tax=Tahibacter amnicola TaxID=2976241 RepID=A0ABY6BFZ9_9GAMM|nr:hypothetical protein [Tahibacter amnicola]UXI68760.1 hypothetical protein N4264_03655 [Tahibacter amnicola]
MRNFKVLGWAGLVLVGFSATVMAADVVTGAAAEGRRESVASEQQQAQVLLGGATQKTTASRSAGAATTPGPVAKATTPAPNAYRAYAPSCLSHPLPEQFSGPLTPPTAPFRVRLAAIQTGVNGYVTEDVNVRLWRIPCSSSGQFYESVTLLAIDRDAANEGNTQRYPLFPGVRVTQGSNTLKLVRVAEEPNTVLSHTKADEPLIRSSTFVLENFASNDSSTAYFDFNNPFTITFFNFFNGDTGQALQVPVYNPTQSTYPTAFQNQPITGYLTGNWYDPAHSGEGILVQVFDLPGNTTRKLFTFAWFTYTNDGRPFWLFGAQDFPIDSRGPLVVPTVYQNGGGFAGNFGASAQSLPWGSVTFNFPTCYSTSFTFNGTANIPGVPAGSGTRNWIRAVDTNGLTCE